MAYDSRESLLSTPMSELPDGPPVLPAGHYYGLVTGYSKGPTPWNGDTEAIFYNCQLTEAGPDINEEAVASIDLRNLNIRPIAFEIHPNRIGDLKRALRSYGVNMELALDTNIPEPVGRRTLFTVTRKAEKGGGTREFNNIVAMVAADE